jgi:hypothetical protein
MLYCGDNLRLHPRMDDWCGDPLHCDQNAYRQDTDGVPDMALLLFHARLSSWFRSRMTRIIAVDPHCCLHSPSSHATLVGEQMRKCFFDI